MQKYDLTIWCGITALLAVCGGCIAAGFVSFAAPLIILMGSVGTGCVLWLGYIVHRFMADIRGLSESVVQKPLILPSSVIPPLRPLTIAIDKAVCGLSEPLDKIRRENQDLSLQNQLLKRRKNSIEAILQTIHNPVLVTDKQDRLIISNAAAERLFDFKADQAASKTIQEILGDSPLADMITKARGSKVRHVRHELSISRDTKISYFDCVLSCAEDDNGQIASVAAVLHDVTREKEVSQAKNDFVSHVSHELKTPLASINAYAEMLVDGEAENAEAIQQFCSIIQSQAQRLNRLIEEILNISRIESGMVKANRQSLSLAMIIRDAVEAIQSYAQEKNITITAPPAILYDQISGDRDMMMQVMINLLSNAVKYTPNGGHVTVESQIHEIDGTINVTVTDTGIGIPEEDIDKLFGKFYRVEANKKFAKGTGLGLNLVKQIIETVHGGKVFVRSRQGQGSTFGFILSLAGMHQMAAQGTQN